MRPDGSVLDEPGHDPATGLMYVTTEAYPLAVPSAPTVDQALDALAKLWHTTRQPRDGWAWRHSAVPTG